MAAVLDAPALRRAMVLFAEALLGHRDELNSLNVYPVPDGDTGTNMLLTQEAVVRALDSVEPSAGVLEHGQAISRASLMGARGNSGVILSQILRGICVALPEGGASRGAEVAGALRRGSEEAYHAVARPAEGTILSVFRDAAEAASDLGGGSPAEVVAAALDAGRTSLARTKEILPELRLAGVVDAGGKGIVLLLDAIRAALAGEALTEPIGPHGPVGRAAADGVLPISDRAFEVQYLLEAEEDAATALRHELSEIGDSLVVVGGGGLYNVHVHTDEPERAVEAAVERGSARDISIVHLDSQVTDCLGNQARAVRMADQRSALVAVAEGEGLIRAFRSLGAVVVEGGPGNNPAVADLLRAVEAAPATAVLVLPNHPNVVAAANRAAEESAKDVRVIEATSIPAGLAAGTAFNATLPAAENTAAMAGAASSAGAGELARAERDAETPAGHVRRGEWIGMARGEAVSVGATVTDVAVRVARVLAGGQSEVIALVAGAGASIEERTEVEEALRESFPRLAVEVIDGGQPRYPFLIGVE